jgi:hypothetical protein
MRIFVDGKGLRVRGPSRTATGATYTGLLGRLSAGSHTYVINATDVNGLSSTYTDTFTV